jgi:hypothetical protein
MPSIRNVRAATGELHIVRDLIFEIDKANKDKQIYNRLGRHPWFRKLIERKTASKLNPWRRGAGERSILPTTTFVITKEDLVLSTKLDFSQFLKNQKLITKIMDSMFLLSIAVYEPELEQITFFYNGFKEPFTYAIKEIKKSNVDSNKDLYESLLNMSRRV